MNPYAAVIAHMQLEQLRADAAEHRLARTARAAQPRRSRFALTIGTLKAPLTSTDDSKSVVPKLTGYPYRG